MPKFTPMKGHEFAAKPESARAAAFAVKRDEFVSMVGDHAGDYIETAHAVATSRNQAWNALDEIADTLLDEEMSAADCYDAVGEILMKMGYVGPHSW